MPPTHFNVSAEPTVNGFIAHCRELEISCEGATEEEARRNVVEAIAILFGASPTETFDLRPQQPAKVRQVRLRPRQ